MRYLFFIRFGLDLEKWEDWFLKSRETGYFGSFDFGV